LNNAAMVAPTDEALPADEDEAIANPFTEANAAGEDRRLANLQRKLGKIESDEARAFQEKKYTLASRLQGRADTLRKKIGASYNGNSASDSAMPGGIDLNAKHLKMESEGDKVNWSFDPAMIAQFKRGDFSGVQIRIFDVVPVDIMPLMGLKRN
jgi:hypothetical protein